MAQVSPLKFICEKTDNLYIQTPKSGERIPVNRKPLPEIRYERNCSSKEKLQRAGSKFPSDGASEDGFIPETFSNFDAIPDEFRPTKKGMDLLKVMTSVKKNDSKEEPQQKERYQISSDQSSELQRKSNSEYSSSSTIPNESRSCKKEPLHVCENTKQTEDLISYETREQKNLSGMFFYNSSGVNRSSAKTAKGRQPNCSRNNNNLEEFSEKSKFKKTPYESTQNKFFNSNSSQSKRSYEFDVRSNFQQNKDDIRFLKYLKNSLPDSTASGQNKDPLIEKITIKKTVTKRVQWNSDLCRFKKPDNKAKTFYEYTKNTKQSKTSVSFYNEENDEKMEKPNQDFKKESFFCQDFHHSRSMRYNDEPRRRFENRKYRRFDSAGMPERKERKQFIPEKSPKPANKFEENRNYSQYSKGQDPIIIKHEVKIFHINGQGKNNRRFHNNYKTSRPQNKDRNHRIINTSDRHGSMITEKTEKNTMPKSTETIQKISETSSLELPDSCSKSEDIHAAGSLPNNNDVNDTAVTLLECGREISDFIAGSSIALNIFFDNYEQWKDFRRVTMLLFEEFEKNLSQSCNKNKRIIEVIGKVGSGCKLIQYVPHVGVSVTAKIIACLSDVILSMFSSSKSAKSLGMDDFQLKKCLQRDMEMTSDIYLYGLQCDTQFQETCEIIEEFHKKIKDGIFNEFVEIFETGFLKEISQLNPKHPEVFYKRLERFYKLLHDRRQSEEGEAFCRIFEDWPDALTILSCLPRRFKTENWDSSPVLKTWEEIYNILQNDQSVVEDVQKKVQDCICMLMREQSIIEKYVMDLKRRS